MGSSGFIGLVGVMTLALHPSLIRHQIPIQTKTSPPKRTGKGWSFHLWSL